MSAPAHPVVRAVSDARDRLVSADDLLLGLQLRCGGTLPGTIAIPALLEAVRKARRHGARLARRIAAQDDSHAVRAWAEVEPRAEGGCDIALHDWQASELPAEHRDLAAKWAAEVDGVAAELVAWLDEEQRILAVHADAPDLADLERDMAAAGGRRWTDFIRVDGSGQREPLHWRLLDGAAVSLPGSDRTWRIRLVPRGGRASGPRGFELLLTAREPAPWPATDIAASSAKGAGSLRGIIGRDIAPVLRQPVARIIANAETIRTRLAGPLADEYAGYAADIAAAGQHLLSLLNDLGDLEAVEANDFTTIPERIDLSEVARQAAGILGVRAREKGIGVAVIGADHALPAIAEFRRALQVLLNLIGNAIRYSPDNSAIRVALESDGARVRASVIDEGPGLSESDQARVFEKFERLGRSGDGGSGLGLYISRRLARAMGGDLRVASAPGKGAAFTLELPAGE